RESHASWIDLTSSEAVLGSPLYMAPEQVRGAKSVDHRADVWSLGVILHELVSGTPPFEADSPSAIVAAIAADAPTPLRARRAEAPADLEAVIRDCLEKDPAARITDVRTLARRLAPLAPARSRASLARLGVDASEPAAKGTGSSGRRALIGGAVVIAA